LWQDKFATIRNSKVLLVGAGGIGCELIKNLVLSGFGEIHVVDLDTIDLSNLNRQFLFRHSHIKQPKSVIAKKTASQFNPDVNIIAYHANIKLDAQFDTAWFSSFDIVFNALDNLEARRHVNHMCLATNTPLIESGTTGFNGQVQVIVPGQTECYDCNPKPVTKAFPVCTIRSTPSEPIHCIVWAKSYLFTQIFGEDDDFEAAAQPDEDQKELEELRKESAELNQVRDALESDNFDQLLFNKVFTDDIERLSKHEEVWKYRKAPVALDYSKLFKKAQTLDINDVLSRDQTVWSPEENLAVYMDAIKRLKQRALVGGRTTLVFDKDDKDTLDFVAAVANLRALTFGIPQKSIFEIKQIAGNIIPAIATTNAIIAGICVIEGLKVLCPLGAEPCNAFLARRPERFLSSESTHPPNAECAVCGVARATVHANLEELTVQTIVDALARDLEYGEEISLITDQLIYDIDFDDNLAVKLTDLGIASDSFITVVDDNETNRVNLELLV
ncbi:hypothetical protein CANCADRAFT_20431, partial [Tortispora caseinolytica NRRL Y-17796]